MIPKRWQQTLGVKLIVVMNFINLVILAVSKLASGEPVWQVRNAPLAVVGVLFVFGISLILFCNQYPNRRKGVYLGADINLTVLLYLLLIDLNRISTIDFALIAMIISIVALPMAYVPRNRLVGIRIPWTYLSEENWHRTNVLAGRLFGISGPLLVAMGNVSTKTFLNVFVTIIVLIVILTVGYSYRLSKKLI
ncbi:SdpI family protein [Lactiplantibacillus sp. DA1]|uniref:SdpI family protein n=1 Tax=Lactiplantibacillus sp. DA1 TaxID=3079857 RepID=UPI00292A6372|nr:SdpI family protein [Lactiplantibacillus sp. DA1]MDV0430850.1 SdpI family protein [Lactiplantibacillus sp. DA1]